MNNNKENIIENSGVRTVERALAIFDCFVEENPNYTLADISKKIGVPPSTTLRLLSTLEQKNYIYKNKDNLRYYVGFKLARLGNNARGYFDFCRTARPFLEHLNEQFDESVGLYMLQNNTRVCIDCIEGKKSLRCIIPIGTTYPLTRGAAGRVMLAYLPEQTVLEYLEIDPYTTLKELEIVRKNRYAISYSEQETGVFSVAAPVFDMQGKVNHSIYVNGPVARINDDLLAQMVKAVKSCAVTVSELMGFRE